MTQQTELPENSEERVLVAHLTLDVDTDQGVKVNIKAGREALMLMLSAVFAELMDDELSVLEMYTMLHCIAEHASNNTVRELTQLEQGVLEQARSRGLELLDVVRATHTTPLVKEMTCNYVA